MAKNNNETQESPDELSRRRIRKTNLYFLITLLIISALSFFYITRFFLVPVLLALAFAALFYPLYAWLLKGLGKHRNMAALASIIILFLGLVIPLLGIIYLLFEQIISLVGDLQSRNLLQAGIFQNIIQWFNDSQLNRLLQRLHVDWQSQFRNLFGDLVKIVTFIIERTAMGLEAMVIDIFLLFFTLFYFFRDRQAILERVLYLSPLRSKYEQLLIRRFVDITRATILGTVAIGLVHGTVSAVTLWLFGIPGWYIWGVVIVFLAFIPILGPWLVMVPAGIILILDGKLWQGITLFVVALVVLNLVDNLLRPWLVGHTARLHDLIILFSTLGGIIVFGIIGFIIGPVIAAIFITFLAIYGMEFQQTLSYQSKMEERKQ